MERGLGGCKLSYADTERDGYCYSIDYAYGQRYAYRYCGGIHHQ